MRTSAHPPRSETAGPVAAWHGRGADKRRVPTPRGGMWHPQLVARVLERLEAA